MGLLPSLSDIIANNPVHKAIGDMQNAIKSARGDIQSLACSLKMDAHSNCAVASPPKTEAKTDIIKVIPANVFEVPTEAETLIELKKRLGKEIAKAENDLTNGLKINNKPCSCMSNKHNVVIEGLAEELMPKEVNNPIYSDITKWFEDNQSKMTVAAVASGKYDGEYIKLAADLGGFRRRLGTGQGIPITPVKDFLKEH